MFKLIPSTVLLSILGILISAKNGIIHAGTSSDQVLQTLFGSADQYPMNWIYWIIFCVGYVILLQIVWKSRVHMFEINQLLRYRNTNWFWTSKFVTVLVYLLLCVMFPPYGMDNMLPAGYAHGVKCQMADRFPMFNVQFVRTRLAMARHKGTLACRGGKHSCDGPFLCGCKSGAPFSPALLRHG